MTPSRSNARLDLGTLLIGIGALVLLASLFFTWFGQEAFDGGPGSTASGWETFELLDIALAGLALAALYGVIETVVAAGRIPAMAPVLMRAAGPVALVLIVVSLINPPPLVNVPDVGSEAGIWLGFGAAALMTIGALLTRVRISVVMAAREQRRADPGAETRTMPDEEHGPPTERPRRG